jgi:hypothetical protein
VRPLDGFFPQTGAFVSRIRLALDSNLLAGATPGEEGSREESEEEEVAEEVSQGFGGTDSEAAVC